MGTAAWDTAAAAGNEQERRHAVAHTAAALALLASEYSNYRTSWGLLAAKADAWLASETSKSAGCGVPGDCVSDADLAVVRWSYFPQPTSAYGGGRSILGW